MAAPVPAALPSLPPALGWVVAALAGGAAAWMLSRRRIHLLAHDVARHRETQLSLRARERQLNDILDTVDSYIFVKDLEGRYIYANARVGRLFGVPVAEILGKGDEAFFSVESVAEIIRSDRPVLERGEGVARLETDLTAADGRPRSYWAVKTPLRDAGGRIYGLCGVSTDISDRIQAETALQAREAHYRALIDAMPDMLFILNGEGVFLEAHASEEHRFLMPRDQFLQRRAEEVLPPDLASRTRAAISAALTTGQGQELNYTLAIGGADRHFEARIVPCTEDTVFCIVRDTTDHRVAEAALQREQAFSASLLASLPGIFFLYSYPDLRLLLCNRQHEAMFGYGPGEVLGRHITEWFPPEGRDRVLRAVHHTMANGPTGELEAPLLNKEGRLIPYAFSAIPFTSGGQRFLMGTGVDISQRKAQEEAQRQLEHQLQQAQKMESLGSLAGGVAHDMNNVLGAILGLATTHLEIQPKDSAVFRSFETIAKAASRGGKVVKSLLAFARHSPAEERDLDLNALLREEASLLERTTLARTQVEMDLAPDLGMVRGDASALSHALMNLCVNAVDAMADNGRLTLRTRNAGSAWVEVVVEDTGCGMTPDVLGRALDPFYTTKAQGKGTGLGLAMVYSTIKAHQGEMTLTSEPGRGTSVILRLPALAPQASEVSPGSAPGEPGLPAPLRVLLVDDDALVRNSVLAMLEILGHAVTEAESGQEALDQVEAGLALDVVVLDMNMPGLDGGETLLRLRALQPGVPVLLVTGRADQKVLDLVDHQPQVHLLPKPFTLGELKLALDPVRA